MSDFEKASLHAYIHNILKKLEFADLGYIKRNIESHLKYKKLGYWRPLNLWSLGVKRRHYYDKYYYKNGSAEAKIFYRYSYDQNLNQQRLQVALCFSGADSYKDIYNSIYKRKQYFNKIRPIIQKVFNKFRGADLFFVGHSLGGYVAQKARIEFQSEIIQHQKKGGRYKAYIFNSVGVEVSDILENKSYRKDIDSIRLVGDVAKNIGYEIFNAQKIHLIWPSFVADKAFEVTSIKRHRLATIKKALEFISKHTSNKVAIPFDKYNNLVLGSDKSDYLDRSKVSFPEYIFPGLGIDYIQMSDFGNIVVDREKCNDNKAFIGGKKGDIFYLSAGRRYVDGKGGQDLVVINEKKENLLITKKHSGLFNIKSQKTSLNALVKNVELFMFNNKRFHRDQIIRSKKVDLSYMGSRSKTIVHRKIKDSNKVNSDNIFLQRGHLF